MIILSHPKTCVRMFIAVLFIINTNIKLTKYSSAAKWIKCGIFRIFYNKKRIFYNKLLFTTWINLQELW